MVAMGFDRARKSKAETRQGLDSFSFLSKLNPTFEIILELDNGIENRMSLTRTMNPDDKEI